MGDTCIFCKIANGEIPSKTVYEDDMFRAILDIDPVSKGHTLILPKKHYANLYELEEETASKVFVLAKKLAGQITKAVACDGIQVLQNNGEAAGQTVFHFHMHLIPGYEGELAGLTMHHKTDKPEYDLEEVKNKILEYEC
jgi:histidine triad (HIT) family protein